MGDFPFDESELRSW